MRWRHCALGWVLLCWVGVSDASPIAFRAMTFNLSCPWCGGSEYGSWGERQAGLSNTLAGANPDLLATQELMFISNLELVRRSLPRLEPHYLDRGLPWLDCVLWVNRERFSVEAEGSFWLSPTPEARVGFGWVWSIPRAVVWLRLKERDSGQALTVVATHMDNNRANKAPGMALLRERLAQLGDTPLLVLGDFNIQAGSPPMTELTGTQPPALADTFTRAQEFHTPGAPRGDLARACKDFIASPFPGCRIDQVLVDQHSNWEVPAYTLDLRRLGPAGNFISDHRGVWVDLKLEAGRP